MRWICPTMAAAVLVLVMRTTIDAAGDIPPLNRAVVSYAQERLGQKIGSRACTELAMAALGEAGACREPTPGDDGEHVWGTFVEARSEIQPGDVLQFRDAVFRGRRRVVREGVVVMQRTRRRFPNHAAIVEEVRDRGRVLVILHQNAGPEDAPEAERRLVRRDVLRMAELQRGGWVKAYRPVMAEDSPPSDGGL